jgi:hypothetical protein
VIPHFEGRHTFQVYENKVLRKISEPKGEEGCGQFKCLHNEELAGHRILSGKCYTEGYDSMGMQIGRGDKKDSRNFGMEDS